MKSASEQLKAKLFGIDQYNQIIVNFKNSIQNFNHYSKHMLRKGRHNKFYQQLENCVQRKTIRKGEKQVCLKQSLHKECLSDFMEFKHCIENKKGKNECNVSLGEYFICIDGSIKQIMLSSTLDY